MQLGCGTISRYTHQVCVMDQHSEAGMMCGAECDSSALKLCEPALIKVVFTRMAMVQQCTSITKHYSPVNVHRLHLPTD